MKEYKLGVSGMKCPKCEARIEKAVTEAFGAVDCLADREKNLVTFRSDANVTEASARAVVEKTGFTYLSLK